MGCKCRLYYSMGITANSNHESILGVRPTVAEVGTHVEEFFFRNRARSKPPVASPLDFVAS